MNKFSCYLKETNKSHEEHKDREEKTIDCFILFTVFFCNKIVQSIHCF